MNAKKHEETEDSVQESVAKIGLLDVQHNLRTKFGTLDFLTAVANAAVQDLPEMPVFKAQALTKLAAQAINAIKIEDAKK